MESAINKQKLFPWAFVNDEIVVNNQFNHPANDIDPQLPYLTTISALPISDHNK